MSFCLFVVVFSNFGNVETIFFTTTAWKVSKYGVFYRKIRTRKNSIFGTFSRSEWLSGECRSKTLMTSIFLDKVKGEILFWKYCRKFDKELLKNRREERRLNWKEFTTLLNHETRMDFWYLLVEHETFTKSVKWA